MQLPVISSPVHETDIELKSIGKKLQYRAFHVKEEKLLLMATQSKETKEVVESVKQIINNCIVTEGVTTDDLASFDIEYLFLKIRGKSLGEVIEYKIKNPNPCEVEGCDKYFQDVEFNIDNVEYLINKEHTNKIMLTDDAGITMKYPTMEDSMEIDENDPETYTDLIINCIDTIFSKDDVSASTDYNKDELKEWVDNMDNEAFKKILNFFNTMPSLKYEQNYNCAKCGKEVTAVFNGAQDFFTLLI